MRGAVPLAVPLLLVALVSTARATTYTVATAGADFTSIQAALNATVAGDTVQVRDTGGPWFLDGTGVPGDDMVRIGFKYADRDLTPDGVLGLTVRSGLLGRARITLKGKADHLAMPALPLGQDPRVTVQLVAATGACWQSVHSAPASKNDGVQFKDAGD